MRSMDSGRAVGHSWPRAMDRIFTWDNFMLHDVGWRAVMLAVFLVSANVAAEPLAIESQSIPLALNQPDLETVGALSYRGGVRLTSSNARFGGLSGLSVSTDGKHLVAVSDTGLWVTGTLTYDAEGRLNGLIDTKIEPLRGADGKNLIGKKPGDAESLTPLDDGGYLVSFEQNHRVLHYDAPGTPGRPIAVALEGLRRVKSNGGLEAVEQLADGRVLALSEGHFVADGQLAGWLIDGDSAAAVSYPGDGYFKPTGMARLADGRLLVLERGYTAIGGVKCRVMLIEAPDAGGPITGLRELARLVPPVNVDNFEGLAVRIDEDGAVLLYIVSDDNFNPFQRTLLMMFRLEGF